MCLPLSLSIEPRNAHSHAVMRKSKSKFTSRLIQMLKRWHLIEVKIDNTFQLPHSLFLSLFFASQQFSALLSHFGTHHFAPLTRFDRGEIHIESEWRYSLDDCQRCQRASGKKLTFSLPRHDWHPSDWQMACWLGCLCCGAPSTKA